MSKQKIPRKALQFGAEIDIDVERNGEDAKSAPFEMLARTGDPIDHWYWGRTVHDMEGMSSKGNIPIDYNHNPDEIIGYGNKLSTEGGDLKIRGALVAFNEGDRASEVLYKARQSVPYEASIFFSDTSQIERVPHGTEVQVNNRTLSGPLTIFRDWKLRGVAVTPYGFDSGTSTALSEDGAVEIEVIDMPTETSSDVAVVDENTPDAEAQAVDANEVNDSPEAAEESQVDGTTEEAVDGTEQEAAALSAPGQRFMDAFGEEAGALYFARGVSFEEAQEQDLSRLRKLSEHQAEELDRLREQLGQLKQQLQASGDGAEAVSFSSDKPSVLTKIPARILE